MSNPAGTPIASSTPAQGVRVPTLTFDQLARTVSDALASNLGSSGIKLDPFRGEKSLNARVWINNFELYTRVKANNDTKRFEVFELFLDGHAKNWYDLLMRKSHPPTDWAALKREFLRKFVPVDEKRELKSIMERRVQGNESVEQYLTAKQVLCLDYNQNMGFSELKDYLIDGLHADIKAPLIAMDPSTLTELLDTCNQIERGLKLSNKLNYGSVSSNSNIEKNLEQINQMLSKICTETDETKARIEDIERGNRIQLMSMVDELNYQEVVAETDILSTHVSHLPTIAVVVVEALAIIQRMIQLIVIQVIKDFELQEHF